MKFLLCLSLFARQCFRQIFSFYSTFLQLQAFQHYPHFGGMHVIICLSQMITHFYCFRFVMFLLVLLTLCGVEQVDGRNGY